MNREPSQQDFDAIIDTLNTEIQEPSNRTELQGYTTGCCNGIWHRKMYHANNDK